jgi:hypothetical protein
VGVILPHVGVILPHVGVILPHVGSGFSRILRRRWSIETRKHLRAHERGRESHAR